MEIADLIGIPFEYNGRGNDSYDCYGLLIELFKRKGIKIPDFKSETDACVIAAMMEGKRHLWHRVDDYTPYSALLIRTKVYFSHCGMYLGDNKFIHTTEKTGGVCIERLSDWHHRIEGFYRYAATN